MSARARLASLALPSAIVFVALVPQAALTGDAEACSKGGSPNARHRLGAIVEQEAATPTDLVVIRSNIETLRGTTPLTPTEASIETDDGTDVPLQRSQLGDGPVAYAGEVRSALVPASPLAPNTSYVVVIRNLVARTDPTDPTSAVLDPEPRRLAFKTGAGPRPPATPVTLAEVSPKTVQLIASGGEICCENTSVGSCGKSQRCIHRDLLTRELRNIHVVAGASSDVVIRLEVTSNRAAGPLQDELGWASATGIRTPPSAGSESQESISLPLLPNEHACVVAVARDRFTEVETASAPFCVDGPGTLAAPSLDCDRIEDLAIEGQCNALSPEIEGLIAKCKASQGAPVPAPADPSLPGSDPRAEPASSSGGSCTAGAPSAPPARWIGSLIVATAFLASRRARERRRLR